MKIFFENFYEYFVSGGILMIPLFILSIYIYFIGFEILFRLHKIHLACQKDDFLFESFNFFGSEIETSKGIKRNFHLLRLELLSGINRDIKNLRIMTGVAPLIGLLGTVSGMMIAISGCRSFFSSALTTHISEGISQALITTQCGLSIAIPAFVLCGIAGYFEQKILINLSKREVILIRKVLSK